MYNWHFIEKADRDKSTTTCNVGKMMYNSDYLRARKDAGPLMATKLISEHEVRGGHTRRYNPLLFIIALTGSLLRST